MPRLHGPFQCANARTGADLKMDLGPFGFGFLDLFRGIGQHLFLPVNAGR